MEQKGEWELECPCPQEYAVEGMEHEVVEHEDATAVAAGAPAGLRRI